MFCFLKTKNVFLFWKNVFVLKKHVFFWKIRVYTKKLFLFKQKSRVLNLSQVKDLVFLWRSPLVSAPGMPCSPRNKQKRCKNTYFRILKRQHLIAFLGGQELPPPPSPQVTTRPLGPDPWPIACPGTVIIRSLTLTLIYCNIIWL